MSEEIVATSVPSRFDRIKDLYSSARSSKNFKLFATLALVLSVPLTVMLAMQFSDIRNRAAGPATPATPPGPIISSTPSATIVPTRTPTPTATPMPTKIPTPTPAVKVAAPANNSRVMAGRPTNVLAAVVNESTVKSIEFYVDSVRLCSSSRFPLRCKWTPPKRGVVYSLTAKALYKKGTSKTSPVVKVTSF